MTGFQPFKAAKVWGWSTIFSAILLLLVLPHRADHMPQGFFAPVLYLELLDDVTTARQFIFGQSDPYFLQKMIWGNAIDFLFMLNYSLFLFYFVRDCHRLLVRLKFYRFLRSWIFVILSADFTETFVLLLILTGNSGSIAESHITILQFATWSKWLSLAAVLAGVGVQLRQAGRFGFTARLLAIPLALLALAGFLLPQMFFEIFSLTVTVQMLLFFIIAWRFRFTGAGAIKPK